MIGMATKKAMAIATTYSPMGLNSATIYSDGLPIVGTTGWAIGATGLVPAGAPNAAFSGIVIGFSSFPFGYPIPNAPATVQAYVLPIVSSSVGFADQSGNASWTFPLPANSAFIGVSIVAQVVDYDPLVPAIIPIGSSQAIEAVIGQ